MTNTNYTTDDILNKDINKDIKNITEIIREKYKPEKIILFGSRAKGSAKKRSDIDLLVIKKTNKKILERQREIANLLKYPIPSDIIVLTPKEFNKAKKKPNYFMREVLNYGKVIF